MSTVVTPVGQCVIVQGVSWDTYTCLVADFADSSGTRIAYDQGTLEFMAPSVNHDQLAEFLSDIVKAVAEVQELDFVAAGPTTFKRETVERGFEPDASFYVQHAAAVKGHTRIDLDIDPPPDLIIEIALSHPSLDKFPIYAALGVHEVWRWTEEQVHIYSRIDDTYHETATSASLPNITAKHLIELVQTGLVLTRQVWMRRVRAVAEALAEPTL